MPELPVSVWVSIFLVIISFGFLYKERPRIAVFILFVAGLVLRLWAAHLDPFLHEWDERFHALVARNMMEDPFTPLLRKSPVAHDDNLAWCCTHVWLHKQPLFMWQMALSMKIFGISPFAIRYPAVLEGALMVVLVYRITRLMTKDKYVSFLAAVLMLFSGYHLELIAGRYVADQNDAAFVFFVLASIWAYAEYIYATASRMKWAIAIGLFVGCAILIKWLTGLLVYSAWGITVLYNIRKPGCRKELGHMLVSLLVAVVVFMPWQLHIFNKFPVEAKHEFEYNTRHITEILEGKEHSYTMYVDHLDDYFGYSGWIALFIGMIILFYKYRNRLGSSLLLYFFIVFLFFSLIVKTQMSSFVFIVVPIGFILMAIGVSVMFRQKLLRYLSILAILFFVKNAFAYKSLSRSHDPLDTHRQHLIAVDKRYRALPGELPPNCKLVLNTPTFDDVVIMFYHNDINAYGWCLQDPILDSLKQKEVPFAAFENPDMCGFDHRFDYKYFYKLKRVE